MRLAWIIYEDDDRKADSISFHTESTENPPRLGSLSATYRTVRGSVISVHCLRDLRVKSFSFRPDEVHRDSRKFMKNAG